MFWIALLALGLSTMLIKLGFLSAVAGVLTLVVKLLVLLIFVGLGVGVWAWLRKRGV